VDWTGGGSAPARLIERSDGNEFGTGFAVLRDTEATWLVTCAHTVDTRPKVTILVNGRGAEIVANGRDQGREKEIDLEVLRVPGLQVAKVLPIGRLENAHSGCSIPGWSKHGEGSYRADCLDAAIVKPFAWTEPGSRLIAQAYQLAIDMKAGSPRVSAAPRRSARRQAKSLRSSPRRRSPACPAPRARRRASQRAENVIGDIRHIYLISAQY